LEKVFLLMSSAKKEHLFVYGTLRKSLNHVMHRVLVHNAEFMGHACFQGKLLDLGKYPGVVSSKNRRERVYGEVYLLTEPQAVLPKLDHYEGCSLEFHFPREFVRKRVSVTLKSGQQIQVWIYLYNDSPDNARIIPGGDYLKFLEQYRPHLIQGGVNDILLDDDFDYPGE
jgi:gamma-glutamylcyclotransferase (GGCT)/AIG2-like uncharacterized protein YtfP